MQTRTQAPLRLLQLDKAVVKANLATVRKHLGACRIMGIVKNQGYGIGLLNASQTLLDLRIDFLGVATTDELVQLRQAGFTCEIFVIHAPPWEAETLVEFNAHATISNRRMLLQLEAAAEKWQRPLCTHLYINTGMNRHGCHPTEALELGKSIAASKWLQATGVLSHFPSADDPREDAFTQKQIRSFQELVSVLAKAGVHFPMTHLANTAGALRFPLNGCSVVRLGLAPWGVLPSEATRQILDLTPSIRLSSRIVAIQTCSSGDTIGYGRAHRVSRDATKIAVIPIGYGDGLQRSASEHYRFRLHDQLVPVAGRICMDYTMLDVTDIPQAKEGDDVILLGDREISVEEQAKRTGLIPHEILTTIGPRIERIVH